MFDSLFSVHSESGLFPVSGARKGAKSGAGGTPHFDVKTQLSKEADLKSRHAILMCPGEW